jgi:hypothetical protein
MNSLRRIRLLATLAAMVALGHASPLQVSVTHTLDVARPSETITVPWTEVAKALPGALLQKIAVKNSSGRSLPYQVTNVAPHAKDPQNLGIAYGELIFQHDFAAGEKTATFTVEMIDDVAPVFPTRTFARHIPERLDDFAWENDKVAHRTYGASLAAPDFGKTGKEILVTSGLDIWSKRVDYPIVDRWYNKGHDHYHNDEGEGMDMYQVGPSRGCGGTGIWDGQQLHVGRNYAAWKILTNGPIRTVFELTYDTWAADGTYVSEVKRFTVDAGHNLDLIESTFTATGNKKELTVGIGLNKNPADRGQEPQIAVTRTEADGTLAQWIAQKSNGQLGTAVVVSKGAFAGFAEDSRNLLLLAKAKPGEPLRYLAGAGWSKAGDFTSSESWNAYVAQAAARLRDPVKVSVTTK